MTSQTVNWTDRMKILEIQDPPTGRMAAIPGLMCQIPVVQGAS